MAEVPSTATVSDGPISRARASLAALETLERLQQAPHTLPLPEDLVAMRGWSGWGPLAPALERSRAGSWKEIGERIAYLLPQDHYDQGFQATYNAFYTPPQITSACWRILTDLGFTGGRILEPGCGAGAFMAATPAGIPAMWTGIERDPTTASIAGLLHPEAVIHEQRLEETPLPTHSMDAVLGNVPFGDSKVYDPTMPRELTANLHNYFIYRSVLALRPGGIAILVTSRYTMDAAGGTAQSARLLISSEAELLGAIRLPNDALTSGGTEPLVDVLVLRRRRAAEPRRPEHDQWITTGSSIGGQQINSYFLANPLMVLGELAEDNAPRWGRTLRVDARPDDPPVEMAMTAAGLAIVSKAIEEGRGWRVDAGALPITVENAPFQIRPDGKKEGSFHLVDGVVHEVIEAKLTPVERPGKELPKLVALRDAVLALLDAEADHDQPDSALSPLRGEANRLYDAYVAAHGYLNRYTVVEGKPDEDGAAVMSRRRPAMGGFRRDPDFVTVLALEDFDDDTRTASKAALLSRRVNRPRARVAHAGTPAEAIALCRDELGRFDLDRVGELLGVDRDEAERRIVDVAFVDPTTGQWVPADEFLTGNVREKLARSKTAAAADSDRFGRNVPALEAVIPVDLQPEQIAANLGAPWVPASDVQEFARELLGLPAHIWHEPHTHTWSVTAGKRAGESAAATADWGTWRLNAYQLLEYGLNGKAPVVYDLIDDKRVRNHDETLAANDRLDAIAARFATWVWEDPDRADRLCQAYNQTFNATVPRRFDGERLTFPGLDSEFEPYPHQRDMVARMISGGDALCPYPVGTGKTATMFMAAVKLKALGLASKPLIIVVPSTLEQIARDGKRLFPNARILMAGKEDLANARSRKLFAARCAMEDWDAVVMSHPSFTSLPVHPTVKADYLAALAADYRSALVSAKSEGAEPRKVKQIAKMVDNLEAEAKALLNHAADDGVVFEHLGTDYLLVDEMHYFKNLGVPVHTDGFSVNGSKRAQDLDLKLGWLRTKHPGQAVITGFTGTPVSNTMLELFILQHYLQPERLKENGLTSADAWAAQFVRFATGVEITPDGGFRLNRRPIEIINVPDLMHTVAEFAELRPPESFPVRRPDARRHIVVVEASDTVRDFVHALAERADDIRAGGVASSVDNILKICSDGRKVALHESLVGLEPEGPGKVGAVAANVARIFHETKDQSLPGDGSEVQGRLQLVFCDLGTPNRDKGNQVYGIVRAQLIAAGIPAERIRFIHEAATDARRMVLFDQCNKGEVAVLLGSTDKLGVGVNVQRRAIALHHVDAPWRPDQVEQREGRVWRPRNLNPSVDIFRYVTKDSFDAFMWQSLERKERSLRPILAGQVTARSVEDVGDVALDFGQIKAVATGNPLLSELNELSIQVKNLSSLAAGHQRNQRRLRADIQTLEMQASAAATNAEALEAIALTAAESPDDVLWLDSRGNPVPKEDEASVIGRLAEVTVSKGYCDRSLTWRGLTVGFVLEKHWRDIELSARVAVTDSLRILVPLKATWAAKGQHWRIRDSIAAAVADAQQTAMMTRANIEDLRQRIAENDAAIARPFAEAAALDAARARRAVLEAAIREQAQKDEETRRNRAVRTAAVAASASAESARDVLLRRLHSAMTVVVEAAASTDAASGPEVSEIVNVPIEVPEDLGILAEGEILQRVVESASNAPLATPAEDGATSRQAESDDIGERVEQADESDQLTEDAPDLEESAEGSAMLGPADAVAPPEAIREPAGIQAASEQRPSRVGLNGTSNQPSTKPLARSALCEQAINLAGQGFAVFPLRPGSKKPLIVNWEKQASTDPRKIERWWSVHPTANIAIACGPSNLLVIDLDAAKKPEGPRHGAEVLTARAAGREIARTFTVASARNGRHLYFRQPAGFALRNTTGSETSGLGPLIDTRGHGGFIVAPGSVFEGGSYRIESEASVAPLPSWIASELTAHNSTAAPVPQATPLRRSVAGQRRTAYGDASLRRSASAVATAAEGTRNDTLNREAFRLGRLVGGGVLDQNDAAMTLDRAGREAGLPSGEIERTVASGLAAGIRHPSVIADRAPDSQTRSTTKEVAMSSMSTQQSQTAVEAVVVPPNAADFYPQLSAPGSHAFQEALRTLWRLGPHAIGLPVTNPEPIRAAWQTAGEQMAAAIRGHEMVEVMGARGEMPLTEVVGSPPVRRPPNAQPKGAADEPLASPEADSDPEGNWADVRTGIERARRALSDWSKLNTADDIGPTIDELLSYLARIPTSMTITGRAPAAARGEGATASAAMPAGPAAATTTDTPTVAGEPNAREAAELSADNLDKHLAAVDTAYTNAQAASMAPDRTEWVGIAAIHSAFHNLWGTIKAATGTYWAELSTDARLNGLLTTLATRAVRAIANLADLAANHLEQGTSRQSPIVEAGGPSLREAYIKARSQVRADAASHEWQRITALWGTVNTLARQTDDPGIRAVVARSADAISDYAETLSRKASQHNPSGASDTLRTLATAAERHATRLRTSGPGHESYVGPVLSATAASAVRSPDSAPRPDGAPEARALQARARQVAQHAQARLGPSPTRSTVASQHAGNVNGPQGPGEAMRSTQPSSPQGLVNMRVG